MLFGRDLRRSISIQCPHGQMDPRVVDHDRTPSLTLMSNVKHFAGRTRDGFKTSILACVLINRRVVDRGQTALRFVIIALFQPHKNDDPAQPQRGFSEQHYHYKGDQCSAMQIGRRRTSVRSETQAAFWDFPIPFRDHSFGPPLQPHNTLEKIWKLLPPL